MKKPKSKFEAGPSEPVARTDEPAWAKSTTEKVEPYITKQTVAERMNVEVQTVTRLMRRGVLGYYKLGEMVRLKWSEVENDLRLHRHAGLDATPWERNKVGNSATKTTGPGGNQR